MATAKPKRKIIQISVSISDERWVQWALCDDGTIWARTNDDGFGRAHWTKVDTDKVQFGE